MINDGHPRLGYVGTLSACINATLQYLSIFDIYEAPFHPSIITISLRHKKGFVPNAKRPPEKIEVHLRKIFNATQQRPTLHKRHPTRK